MKGGIFIVNSASLLIWCTFSWLSVQLPTGMIAPNRDWENWNLCNYFKNLPNALVIVFLSERSEIKIDDGFAFVGPNYITYSVKCDQDRCIIGRSNATKQFEYQIRVCHGETNPLTSLNEWTCSNCYFLQQQGLSLQTIVPNRFFH